MFSIPTSTRTALLAVVLILSASAQGDDCSSATSITGAGAWPFDSTNASTSGFSGLGGCGGGGSLDFGPDRFFQWTATTSGDWTLDTCGSSYDTKLNAHSGAGCSAHCITYNDDGACGNLDSVLHLAGVTAGDTFLIQIGGYNGASGVGVLNVLPHIATGSNSDCSTAAGITGYGVWGFNTSGASTSGFSGGGACADGGSQDLGPDMFWQWTASAAGDVEILLTAPHHDTKLNVHMGAGCAASCLDYNDDAYMFSSAIVLRAVATGETFLIQVGGWDSQAGAGTMEIAPAPAAPNDGCSTAIPLAGIGSWPFNTGGATTSLFSGGGACYSDINMDLFWEWTAPSTGDFVIATGGSSFDPKISVHAGSGCGATCIAFDDDSGVGYNSQVLVENLAAGDTVLVQVGGWGIQRGPGQLAVTEFFGPCSVYPPDAYAPNQSCATAAAIEDGSYSLAVCKSKPDFFTLTVADGDTLSIDVFFSTGTADVDAMLYGPGTCSDDQGSACDNTLACGYSGSDNENLVWTNTTGSEMECVLRVHLWPDTAGENNTYDLVITGALADGPAMFCNPANTHSGGSSVTLAYSGFSGPQLFHLEAAGGPIEQFGYFLVAATPYEPGIPVSLGRLCLLNPIGRYSPSAGPTLNSIGRFDGAGLFQSLGGNSSVGTGFDVPAELPSPPGGVISSGSSWHFQLWYRDGAASNFSNGVSVLF